MFHGDYSFVKALFSLFLVTNWDMILLSAFILFMNEIRFCISDYYFFCWYHVFYLLGICYAMFTIASALYISNLDSKYAGHGDHMLRV